MAGTKFGIRSKEPVGFYTGEKPDTCASQLYIPTLILDCYNSYGFIWFINFKDSNIVIYQ